MSRILIVEDESALRADLVDYMSLNRFDVAGAGSAAEMWQTLAENGLPDVLVLDITLPDGNGFDLAEQLREKHDTCGIIMLTAHGDTESRVRGFDSGADIYLVKHTSLREILAAVQSLLRRLPSGSGEGGGGPEWVLDSVSWKLRPPEGMAIKLTATEKTFLEALVVKSGATCTREDLARQLASRQTQFDNRHLDAVVSRLRRKIQDQTGVEPPIKSVYGVGYSFSAVCKVDS
ncbi:response regulator transcription factor [Roseibium sp. M-1]